MTRRISGGDEDDAVSGHSKAGAQPEGVQKKLSTKDAPPLNKAKLWLALAVPLASSATAGSREPWALSIVAALVGLNMALVAPRARVKKAISWPLWIALLLSLGGLLPMVASPLPEWRSRLMEDFGIQLGGLVSPQPWVTLEGWILLVVCLSWLWFCLGGAFTDGERRWLVRWLCVGTALIAGVTVAFASYDIVVPHWLGSWGIGGFGPFPNRNHYGCYLAIGLVLTTAAGDDALRQKKASVILYIACAVPILWALTKNTSRAAFILSFAGLVTWMSFTSFRSRSSRRIAVSVAILLTMTALFSLFGKSIVKRFEDTIKSPDGVMGDGRIVIFQTTVDMISRAPLLGVGLGNYEPVYALVRPPTGVDNRVIHPENDWLWLAAEAGLPTMLMILFALCGFIISARPWFVLTSTTHTGERLRIGCAISAFLVPAHGMVDVSGHNPGIAFTAILLAGLSLRQKSIGLEPKPAYFGILRMAAAVFSLAAASVWMAISLGRPVLPGNSSAEMLRNRAFKERNRGDLAAARQSLTLALSMKPFLWEGYFDRAAIALAMKLTPEKALIDFARARYLEPNSANICNAEALMWMPIYPGYAASAWRMAISRSHARALSFYSQLCSMMIGYPDLQNAARKLATDSKLKFVYLQYVENEEFNRTLRELLQLDPNLRDFSSIDRLRIFRIWYARGDRAALLDALEHNASWRADGWRVLAWGRANNNNDYKGACRTALEYLKAPSGGTPRPLADLEKLRREFLFHSTDSKYGFDLYEVEKANGLSGDALLTLEKIASIPNAPIKVLYEQAIMLMQKGDFKNAWVKLSAYMEADERAAQSG